MQTGLINPDLKAFMHKVVALEAQRDILTGLCGLAGNDGDSAGTAGLKDCFDEIMVPAPLI